MSKIVPVTNKIIPISDPDLILCLGNYAPQEARGKLALDKSRYGNHGTMEGGARWEKFGDYGQAFKLGWNSGKINCGNDSSLDFDAAADYTWLGWFKTTDETGGLISKSNYYASGYDIVFGDGMYGQKSKLAFISSADMDSVQAVSLLDDGIWHPWAITYSNKAVKIYVEKEMALDGQGIVSGAGGDSVSNVLVGYGETGASYLQSMSGEIKMYKRLLTVDRMRQEIYNSWIYKMLQGVR